MRSLFAEHGWRHPVAAVADVGTAPLAVRLFGEDYVLWRGADGAAHAFVDRCPHRGTRLSLGRIVIVDHAAHLQCAYHGWRFDGAGRCSGIPALPDLRPTAAQAATALDVDEAYGLYWVALSGADGARRPSLGDMPARQVICGPYEVATSAPRVVENFLDTAHFAFVHPDWLGATDHAEVPDYEVVVDADGAPGVPRYRAWQPRASAQARGGAWVDYRYQVLGPYSALLVKQAGAGGRALREAYALWVAPIDAELSRVWFTLFTSDMHADAARLRAFQDTIFGQDKPILESQRPRLLPLGEGEAHSAADRLSVAYRRYLRAQGVRFGVC